MTAVSKNSAVTYYPGTKKFYLGSLNIEKGADFTHDGNYEKLAKMNPDKKIGDGRIEFIDSGVEMKRQAERQFRQGNLDETSLGNITVIGLLQEVIRREWRDFHAIEGTKKIPVPKLQLDVAITDKFSASKKVPEYVEPDQKTNKFTQANLRLFKNMISIYESDESQLKATIEPLSHEIDQAAGSLGKAANEQIILEQETYTTVASADWGAFTTDHSTTNPLEAIAGVVSTITGNHFRPNVICMHPTVLANYMGNTFISGVGFNVSDATIASGFPLPKYPQLRVVQDVGYTATIAPVFDINTMLLGEGPTTAEAFRNPLQSADGWVIRQWLHPLKVTNDGGRELTTLVA